MKDNPTYHQLPSFDPLLGTVDAAAYLGVHPETLKRLARVREIASVRSKPAKGSNIRFRLSALNAWVKAHETRASRTKGCS